MNLSPVIKKQVWEIVCENHSNNTFARVIEGEKILYYHYPHI